MDYKKIEKDNYNIHFINTNRFKTVTVEINFTKDLEEKNISYFKFLSRLMSYSNKKYNTRKKMAIKCEELYGSSVFASSSVIGSMENFMIGVEFLNPAYTEESEWKNNLELLFSSLLEPNVDNKGFDEKIFNLIKDSLITNFKIREEYPSSIAYRNFESIMFKGSPASYDSSGKLEVIEKLTREDLYKFYKTLFKNHAINIMIYGKLEKEDEEFLLKTIEKKMSSFKSVPSNNFEPFVKRKLSKDVITKVEKKNVTQSSLIMGYNIDGLDKNKYDYALTLYNMILGASSNSVLFLKVREENSFCYTVRSSLYKYSNALVITAGINKKNYEDCVRVIKECMTLLTDPKTIEMNLEKVKKTMNTRLNDFYDSSSAISDHYYINEFDKEDDIEVARKKYNDVTVEDILEVGKYLKLSVIYFLEGTREDENA